MYYRRRPESRFLLRLSSHQFQINQFHRWVDRGFYINQCRIPVEFDADFFFGFDFGKIQGNIDTFLASSMSSPKGTTV